MIPIKNEHDLGMMRQAGKILSAIMKKLERQIRVGITTAEIDSLAQEYVDREHVRPAFKGYRGYPAVICASINDEIVHGIPSSRALLEGDILSLDLGIDYEGYFSDAAFTVSLGRVSPEAKRLIEVTRQALTRGIKQAKADNHLFDISSAIQKFVEENGFSVVRQFVGHGIGRALHEEPEVPNFGQAGLGPVLKAGMVLAIEPMVNLGSWESRILDNGWTAVAKDGRYSAHFEHTVAITPAGPEVLTN